MLLLIILEQVVLGYHTQFQDSLRILLEVVEEDVMMMELLIVKEDLVVEVEVVMEVPL